MALIMFMFMCPWSGACMRCVLCVLFCSLSSAHSSPRARPGEPRARKARFRTDGGRQQLPSSVAEAGRRAIPHGALATPRGATDEPCSCGTAHHPICVAHASPTRRRHGSAQRHARAIRVIMPMTTSGATRGGDTIPSTSTGTGTGTGTSTSTGTGTGTGAGAGAGVA